MSVVLVVLAMENHYFSWVNSLYMAMFNSYVSLPEGISISAESFAILHESAETFRELPGFSRAPATLAAQAGVNLG